MGVPSTSFLNIDMLVESARSSRFVRDDKIVGNRHLFREEQLRMPFDSLDTRVPCDVLDS